MKIGEGFKDDMGFVRRTGVTRQFYDVAFLPQPEALRKHGIRQLQPHARAFIYDDPQRRRWSAATVHIANQTTWNNGSFMEYAFEPRVEAITRPFAISPGVAIPAGRYDWNQHLRAVRRRSQQARCPGRSATPSAISGAARRRTRRPACCIGRPIGCSSTSACRSATSSSQLPDAEFTTTLVNLRTGYSFSTNMFLDTLLQYRNDVKQFSANVRFNLIHRPLSDFFIVYNESQFTDSHATDRPRAGGEVHADVLVLARAAASTRAELVAPNS